MHIGIKRTELISVSVETGEIKFEHFHEDPELIMVLEGKLKVSLGGERYLLDKEDCILINSNCKHKSQPLDGGCFLRISISNAQLKELFGQPVIEFWCNSAVDDGNNYIELRKLLRELLEICIRTNETDIMDYYSKCYQCLRILSEKFLIYKGTQLTEDLDEDEQRYLDIVNYIHSNYTQHIGLEDLSEQVHLTTAYLSKYFKKRFGVNFIKYLNNVRMSHAMSEITDTDETITQIAYENGFPNMASFNKLFRETYDTTPLAYRTKVQKEREREIQTGSAEVEKKFTLQKIEDYLREHPKDEDKNISQDQVVVSCKSGKTFEKNWSRIINVGTAEDLLQSTVQEHVLMVKKELGIQYVRFWNIFGSGMHVEAGKNGNYNFTNIYRVLDFILSIGVKPYIELGIKPKQIFKSIANMIEIQDDTNIDNIENLKNILNDFLLHICRRYGVEEVNSWYFESWEDPKQPLEGPGITYFDFFNTAYEC